MRNNANPSTSANSIQGGPQKVLIFPVPESTFREHCSLAFVINKP